MLNLFALSNGTNGQIEGFKQQGEIWEKVTSFLVRGWGSLNLGCSRTWEREGSKTGIIVTFLFKITASNQ